MSQYRFSKRQREFLQKFADLCEEYGASFFYTIDDDGIHIDLNGVEVYSGFFTDQRDIENMRAAAKARK